MRISVLLLMLFGFTGAVYAQGYTMRVFPMQYADAEVVAAYLGGAAPGGRYDAGQVDDFAHRSIDTSVRRLRGNESEWMGHLEARSYPADSGGAGIIPPDGLSMRPVALREQNSLVVRGTQQALDEVQELLLILDRPTPMVNIDVQMQDSPTESIEQWGIDLHAVGSGLEGMTRGNVPPGGLQLRWGIGRLAGLAGWDRRSSRGRTATGAQVTTFNNSPAAVRFGEVLPFFVSNVSYDWWGRRHVTMEPWSIFTGIELWVNPRITGDDTVTMHLRPTIVEGAGAVTAPDGSSIPITKTTMTETTVRVKDGESLVIAGFNRMQDSQTERFSSLLGRTTIRRSSNPVLIVTPTIIRENRVW